MILIRDPHLLWGFTGIFAAALIGNIALGKFNLGFANQPIAHTAHLWNFLGLAVVGFAAVLAGGCPLRQLIMAGEGDTDAVLTVLGMVAGAAFAHNFGLAGSAAGVAPAGRVAVLVALAVLVLIGFGHRLQAKARRSEKEVA
jgi:YedE family putative selenium metabolism protein